MSASHPLFEHYARFDEDTRLTGAFGEFECVRTQELIARYLPATTGVVIDAGGGTGAHAFWLAGRGHQVHLIDRVPRHVEVALTRQASNRLALASAVVGDARDLPFPDGAADLVLLAGPLYHLVDRAERMRALRESHRVLRSGGLLLSVAINRYAGVMYGLTQGLVFESDYFDMTARELATGIRTNPPAHMKTFQEAYFHTPNELVAEISSAGFDCDECLGVVGPAWQVPELSGAWRDTAKRERLVSLARQLEHESVLSPQLFCAARK